jgi:hypothetical protein
MSNYDPIYNPSGLVKDYTKTNIYPISNSNEYDYNGITQPQTQPISNGRSQTGMTSAEQQMTGDTIQTGAGIAVDIGLGYLQSKENEKNRKEDRRNAEQVRQDTLNQRNTEISFKNKIQEQEEKAFQIQKTKDEYDLRFERFITSIQKSIESKQKIKDLAANLFSPEKANTIQQFMLQGMKQ